MNFKTASQLGVEQKTVIRQVKKLRSLDGVPVAGVQKTTICTFAVEHGQG
jgi:hypothetical protein